MRFWAVAVMLSGCFGEPIARVDAQDSEELLEVREDTDEPRDGAVSEEVDSEAGEVSEDVVGDASAGDADGGADGDVDGAVGDSAEKGCEGDEDCEGLGAPPCRVGRCVEGLCEVKNLAVSCDDGDPCTTEDKCGAGECRGRLYTSDEAKNWYLQFGGSGEAGAFGVAAHPSGDAIVVGGFTGEMKIPGTVNSVNALGVDADAFVARITDSGSVLRMTQFGTAEKSEVGVAVVVGPAVPGEPEIGAGNVVVASNVTALDGSPETGRVTWLFDIGTERGHADIPSMIYSIDALEDGSVFVLFGFEAPLEVTLKDGSTVGFGGTGRRIGIARARPGGLDWVKAVVPEVEAETINELGATNIIANEGRAVTYIWSAAQWGYDGQSHDAGSNIIEIDGNGTLANTNPVSESLQSFVWFSRAHGAGYLRSEWNLGTNLPASSSHRLEPDGDCTVEIAQSDADVAWGTATRSSTGMMIHGFYFGSPSFQGLQLPAGQTTGFLAHYDSTCQITALNPNPVPFLNDWPRPMMFALQPEVRLFGSDAAITKNGWSTLSGFMRLPLSLGPGFGGRTVLPEGISDALILGLHPSIGIGCEIAP